MQSGLLWYAKSAKSLTEKIADAANRYQQKFGTLPDTCFVNPSDAPANSHIVLNPTAAPQQQKQIHVIAKKTIMRDYLWLGVSAPQRTTFPL